MKHPACGAALPLRASTWHRLRAGFATAAILLAGCQALPPAPPAAVAEPASLTHEPRRAAAASAHPLATAAALQMLGEGGSVVDAAIAAQMVLGLVEPQSSGIGGGTLLMVWSQSEGRLRAYDGLASAPARVTASLRTDVDGSTLPAQAVARGGRSVGVPGTLAVLDLAHRRHGRLPWARLFEPAIRLAENGYPMAPYVQAILARDPGAKDHPAFRELLFDTTGTALPAGSVLRNPDYARTLRTIAGSGAEVFWRSAARPGWSRPRGRCSPRPDRDRRRLALSRRRARAAVRAAEDAAAGACLHVRPAVVRRSGRVADAADDAGRAHRCRAAGRAGLLAPLCRGRAPGQGRPAVLGRRPRLRRRAGARAWSSRRMSRRAPR